MLDYQIDTQSWRENIFSRFLYVIDSM